MASIHIGNRLSPTEVKAVFHYEVPDLFNQAGFRWRDIVQRFFIPTPISELTDTLELSDIASGAKLEKEVIVKHAPRITNGQLLSAVEERWWQEREIFEKIFTYDYEYYTYTKNI